MPLPVHTVTSLRTGTNEHGELEIQLLYGRGRGSSIWFKLSRSQALKLYREIEALQDEAEPVWTPVMKKPIKLAE